MISIVVCVEYDDLLAITLPRAIGLFSATFVITTDDDVATHRVVNPFAGAYLLSTDSFYLGGDHFNKGRALDDVLQYLDGEGFWDGWCCHWDADIVFPTNPPFEKVRDPSCLYTPHHRRACVDPHAFQGQTDWNHWPIIKQSRFFDSGYCQIFHREAPCLAAPPFYPREWSHAGNSDTFFNDQWPKDKRRLLPFDVLHLGEDRRNWHGRSTDRLDGRQVPFADQRANWMTQMRAARKSRGSLQDERTHAT
jgi:hypothetical protein